MALIRVHKSLADTFREWKRDNNPFIQLFTELVPATEYIKAPDWEWWRVRGPHIPEDDSPIIITVEKVGVDEYIVTHEPDKAGQPFKK